MTQVKETRPKGAKVDHSKPTQPKLGRFKLARASKRLALEIEAEQDHPEGRLTGQAILARVQRKYYSLPVALECRQKHFRWVERARSVERAGRAELFFGDCSVFEDFDLCT